LGGCGVHRGPGGAREKNRPRPDRAEAGIGHGENRNLHVPALDRQPVGTWQCLARRQQRKLLTRRQNEGHGEPRRPCATTASGGIRRGRFAPSVALRGSPFLRVESFSEFRASTGAAWFFRLRARARIGTSGPAMIRSRA
jgi:hypothetical protein